MQLRRNASSEFAAEGLIVAAGTICCWTFVMGAAAASGAAHAMLDVITAAVVCALGCIGVAARARLRNTASAQRPTTPAPAQTPTERACLAIAQAHDLSLREREVLALMATGITGKEIAAELTLSYNTVKSHTRHIYDKLGVHRKQDLADLIESQKAQL